MIYEIKTFYDAYTVYYLLLTMTNKVNLGLKANNRM